MQEQIYRTIRDQPFVIPEESYDDILLTFFAPEMEGYLYKQGGRYSKINHSNIIFEIEFGPLLWQMKLSGSRRY